MSEPSLCGTGLQIWRISDRCCGARGSDVSDASAACPSRGWVAAGGELSVAYLPGPSGRSWVPDSPIGIT